MRISMLVVLALVLALASPPTARAAGTSWPIPGAVVRAFDPPEVPWGSGHRGVDLAGAPGDRVTAPRAGTVSFAGHVGGKPVVVITHGDTRTTLEPVIASVQVGRRVGPGEAVGELQAGHAPCPVAACLHWGVKRGDEYLDPLALAGAGHRLLPESAVAEVQERARAREQARLSDPGLGPGGTGPLAQPTVGRLGSRFGMRFHPIFHEWRMHNGIDISNACGTPLYAAADGVASHVGFDPSGGWRLVIAHGAIDEVDLQTVYLHAEGYRVRTGDLVSRGQVVGTMGTTGWSTGCHLHFSVKANGHHADPLRWLG